MAIAAGGSGGRAPLKGILLWAGRLGVTVVVTVAILRAVGLRMADLGSIRVDTALLDGPRLTLSVGLLLAAFGASALLWRSLVVALGGPSLGGRAAFAVTMVANLGRYLPGKVFQLLGLAWLGRRMGVSAAVSTGAAVLGQVLHLVAAAMVGGALLSATGVLPPSWRHAPFAAGILAAALISWPGVAPRLLRTIWARQAGQIDGHAARGPGPKTLLPWTLGYVGNWLLLGLAFQALATGLGLALPYGLAVSAFAAAYLLGYLALFAPAGIGVREGFLVAFLGTTLGPGPALTLATAQRVWMTGVEALGAALTWPGLRPFHVVGEPADEEAGDGKGPS